MRIAGIYNYGKKIIKKMVKGKYYRDDFIELGGNSLFSEGRYTIISSGSIYNAEEIRSQLLEKGYHFKTDCDEEVILKGYIEYKEGILDYIEGMFAFVIYDGTSIFMARDHFGIKPLFYTRKEDKFLFASTIKSIFNSKLVEPIINRKSLQELLGLGPSRIPGSGIFKNIKELKPAHYLIYREGRITIKRYWDIKDDVCKDTFDEAKKKIHDLLSDSIKRQMNGPIASLLSGGLDSSIIVAVASTKIHNMATYSIDYEGNETFFKANDYQVSRDNYFIDIVCKRFKTKHSYKVISQRELAASLKAGLLARDYPGMADIDSSLYWLSKKIGKKERIVLSGEGADEIFGGYPWFYKDTEGFPWINNKTERINLLHPDIKEKLNLEDFVRSVYEQAIKESPTTNSLFYLNMIWFMPTLLERKERMTVSSGVEARLPFADKKLVEYLWNLPWEYKYHDEKEKGLLREAFKEVLPKEILERKKNPYPKTHNPEYAKLVCRLLRKSIRRKSSILRKIFDINKIKELIETEGTSFKTPWFGQLMTGPQLIAYLYQFDLWFRKYKIKLEL